MVEGIELEKLVGEKELQAYKTYIELTLYDKLVKNDECLHVVKNEYTQRDMNFPIDLMFMG